MMIKRHNNSTTINKASSPTRIAQKFAKNKIAMASLIFDSNSNHIYYCATISTITN